MKVHAELGHALRDAAVRGDLDAVKTDASQLAHLRFEPTNPTWNQKAEVMNAAAATIVQSLDLGAAVRTIAALAAACGDCHAALEGPSSSRPIPVAADGGARSAMLRHQWAATQLWDGLATPSDAAWTDGATMLADPALAPELLTPCKTPVPKVGELIDGLRALGQRAQKATTIDARRAAYAETLSRCAGCHSWLGGGPAAR
jgi:hypothetical protein